MDTTKFKAEDRTLARIIVGILGVLGLTAVWGLYLALPFLITMAQNIIILGLEVAALLAIVLCGLQAFLLRDTVMFKMQSLAMSLRKKIWKERICFRRRLIYWR